MNTPPASSPKQSAASTSDSVFITNARVIDGTGAPEFAADISIEAGIITAITPVGAEAPKASQTVVAARGAVVSPGFIDVHSHADNAPLLEADDTTKIAQGVTTEITGNCGYSLAPVAPSREAEFEADSHKLFDYEYAGWHGVPEWFAHLDTHGTVTNICPLIGHGTLRLATIGSESLPASAEDVDAMGELLSEAIDAGAFGFSSGLIYPPGVYSNAEELSRLAAHIPTDRIYATHMRDESARLLESIDEALEVGRRAGCRVQISHLKAAGKQNWGGVQRAIDTLDAARAAGVRVTQDVYPYVAASTSLGICLPPWAHNGGVAATVRMLHEPETVQRMRDQINAGDDGTWENVIYGAGFDGIMIADTRSHRHEGQTLPEVALELGVEPLEALFTLLREEEMNVSMVIFDMAEADLETALRSPHTTIGSDGLSPGRTGKQHPRLYGTFPRVLGHYVRERGVLTLVEAVRRMTSLPAEVFSVPNRGVLAVGKVADIVCFDPESIAHPGSFAEPDIAPVGVNWVMQSGRIAIADGEWLGTRLGARLLPV